MPVFFCWASTMTLQQHSLTPTKTKRERMRRQKKKKKTLGGGHLRGAPIECRVPLPPQKKNLGFPRCLCGAEAARIFLKGTTFIVFYEPYSVKKNTYTHTHKHKHPFFEYHYYSEGFFDMAKSDNDMLVFSN